MQIAVLGGGHGCYAAAVHLTEQGHSVRFWRRDAAAFEPVLTGKTIKVKDFRGDREVAIACPTTDLGTAITGAELIVIPLPSTTHESLSEQVAPYLEDGQVVFLPPGTFGSFLFARALAQSGNTAAVSFAETGTLPYLARKHAEDRVVISGYATRLPTGVWPARETDRALGVIAQAYPVERCENALSGALMNAGPIIHPPLILMNAGPLEHFEAWDIHNEGTQPAIRRVTDALDAERVALREALGFSAPHFPLRDHYDTSPQADEWMYGRAAHERLTDSGDWREDIDLRQHRYMVEDTRLGLSLLVSVGRWAGIQMPVTEGLLNIACPVAEQDLYETGRTLETLGLSHMTREQLNTLLQQGFTTSPVTEEKAPIGIIGAGRMGRGIALAYAFAGVPVLLVDAKDRDDADRQRLFSDADEELRRDLAFLARVGLLSSEQISRVMERVSYLSMAQGATELGRCDIVYEAVPERMDAKERAFRYASEVARDDAVVASTTSTFLVSDLAKRLDHPQRCINAHWLNPAHLIPLVELSCEASVDDRALALLQESLHTIGKVTVVCSASPGYIVPRIQSLALNEAARLVADGVASAEDIDKAVRNGFGPRYAVLGLLEFIDWGGGDILYYASNYLADNLDPRYGPPDIVAENMRAGRNGVREGQGFFDYRDMDTTAYREARMTEFVQLLGHRGLLPRFMSAKTGKAGIASE